ncbi:hypothetical protein [Pontibacter ruber]|uniref:Uncharacterized protein n=1 Tax=Pontibacter ruber TaxID=1343895 RepID=A0ABW5CXA0_9BACT|nr:hypothetical protein [Pontibacter ruber]
MITSNNYTYFLTYDQTGEWDIELGETNLSYSLSKNELNVISEFKADKKMSFFKDSINVHHKVFHQEPADVRTALTAFLIEHLSDLGYGHPWYVRSDMFTKVEFDDMLNAAIKLIRERKAKARLNTSELTQVCETYKLNPEPCNDTGTSWQASCPSRRGHWIAISTESNTWGCGYCRKKGGINELAEWIEEIKLKSLT